MFIGNSTIKNSLKSVNIWQSYKQDHGCLILYGPGQHTAKNEKMHETITFLLVTFPNIYKLKKNFTDRLSNRKPGKNVSI